ncbi:hypothetical protein PIB30_100498, partial [Stylosanthes scabra]|nr:hypothetical protein [Stylosanthes scabra]
MAQCRGCGAALMKPTNAAIDPHGTHAMVECRGLPQRDSPCCSQPPMPHPIPMALVHSNLVALPHDTRYKVQKACHRPSLTTALPSSQVSHPLPPVSPPLSPPVTSSLFFFSLPPSFPSFFPLWSPRLHRRPPSHPPLLLASSSPADVSASPCTHDSFISDEIVTIDGTDRPPPSSPACQTQQLSQLHLIPLWLSKN